MKSPKNENMEGVHMTVSQQSLMEASNPTSFNFDLDEWLLNLVLLNHPEWKRADGSCPDCETEIERMQERADTVEVLDIDEDPARRWGRACIPAGWPFRLADRRFRCRARNRIRVLG